MVVPVVRIVLVMALAGKALCLARSLALVAAVGCDRPAMVRKPVVPLGLIALVPMAMNWCGVGDGVGCELWCW